MLSSGPNIESTKTSYLMSQNELWALISSLILEVAIKNSSAGLSESYALGFGYSKLPDNIRL